MKHTENRIKQALIELLSEKPYNKITVKNIIERCGVNRGTFYYHYQDIPSLLNQLGMMIADEIISSVSEHKTPRDFLLPLMQYGLANKGAVLNMYHTMPEHEFTEATQIFSRYFVDQVLELLLREQPLTIHECEVLLRYYSSLLTGIAFDWLAHDMAESYLDDMVMTRSILKKLQWAL